MTFLNKCFGVNAAAGGLHGWFTFQNAAKLWFQVFQWPDRKQGEKDELSVLNSSDFEQTETGSK